MRRKVASIYSSSVKSWVNVSCWLNDFCGSRAGISGRSSMPWANCAQLPRLIAEQQLQHLQGRCRDVAESSPSPAALSRAAVFGTDARQPSVRERMKKLHLASGRHLEERGRFVQLRRDLAHQLVGADAFTDR